MAITGQADGTIVIDTAIDTSGIEIGGRDIQDAMLRVGKKINSVGESMKRYLQETGSAFSEQKQIHVQTEKQLEAVEEKTAELNTAVPETDEYRQLVGEIKDLEEQISLAKQKQDLFLEAGGSTGSPMYVSTARDIERMNLKLDEAITKKKQLEAAGEISQGSVSGGPEETAFLSNAGRMSRLAESLKIAFLSLKNGVVSYIQQLQLLSKVKRIAIGIFKRFGALVKKVGSAMLGLNKKTKKTNMSMGRMLATSLLFSTVFRAISLVTNGIKEGFQNLSQYSKETNADMSMLVSSLTQLKNSFATAFAPILSVVAPILSKFINMISQAITYVGMFFAALTGKSTFNKAVSVQEDYAAGLSKTASAAKDAEKALNGYLSPIDEINKMEKQDTSSNAGGAGGGGGGVSPGQMFETVNIESPIKDIAAKLRELIQSEDWAGLGAYIATGINTGFQKLYSILNWDTYGPQITYFVNALTATLNSLMYNIDWNLIGATFGTGINTIVNTLNLAIEGFDWTFLGVALAGGLMSIIEEVDWKNLGNFIGNKFMMGWRTFEGFIKSLNFKKIGLALADLIKGTIKKIDLRVIGSSLSTLAIGLMDALSVAIQNTNWAEIGNKISQGLASVNWTGIADSLFELMGSALGGLASLLGGVISDAVEEAKSYFQDKIEEAGGDIAGGILFGIVDGLAAVGTWIKEHVFEPILEGFQKAFGIHSPSTVMAEQGNFRMEGLFNGMTSLLDKVLSIFTDLENNIRDAFDYIQNNIMIPFDSFLQSVFTTDWTEQFGILGEILNGFFKGFSDVWEGVKKIMGGIIDFVSGVFSGNWSKAWDGVKKIFSGAWDAMAGVAKTICNTIIGIINGMIRLVESGLNGLIGIANGITSKIPSSILSDKLHIPKAEIPRIPYLASGAVIPPNAPFMAMLGDQKNGNNLEMPESLLRRIVREESGGNKNGATYRFTGQINRRVLFDEMITEAKMIQSMNGRNPFELA